MRSFSSGGVLSKALKWIRRGTTQNVQWVEYQVESSIDEVPALANKAASATVEGDPHPTPSADGTVDPWHASGTIRSASGTRLTSYHAYPDGRVVFSKAQYGSVQVPGVQSSTSQPMQYAQPATAQLTWRLNANEYPEWWDGRQWVQGEYFSEHQKWMAWYGGQWHEYRS